MYKIGRFTLEYMKGLSEFIKCVEDHREKIRETKISCPCKECRNNVGINDPNMIRVKISCLRNKDFLSEIK